MKPRIDIFIFADALGWAMASRRHFAEHLLPRRNRCETLLGYSSTCDPTILTGTLPREHRHFSFFIKAPGVSPFTSLRHLGFLPEIIAGHHRIRNKVSKFIARRQGYTGYFQLYSVPFSKLPYLDYTEKKDIYEPGGITATSNDLYVADTNNHAVRRISLASGRVDTLRLTGV